MKKLARIGFLTALLVAIGCVVVIEQQTCCEYRGGYWHLYCVDHRPGYSRVVCNCPMSCVCNNITR